MAHNGGTPRLLAKCGSAVEVPGKQQIEDPALARVKRARTTGPYGQFAGHGTALISADPDDVSAQIDLIGVPWLMIGEEPSAAPNGGDARQGNVVDHHSA